MAQSTKLKPCPFCGKVPRIISSDCCDGFGNVGHAVVCRDSHCCVGPVRCEEKDAVAAWNERVTE